MTTNGGSTPSSHRVAAIDCGTNSTRLLVADLDAHGNLRTIERLQRITRLGQDVDRLGALAPKRSSAPSRSCGSFAT